MKMQKYLTMYMPKEVIWNEPKGGFYIWLNLPKGIHSTDIFKKSVKKGVVFVTGKTFDPIGEKDDCLRLSYSNVDKKDIEKGVKILAKAVKKVLFNNS